MIHSRIGGSEFKFLRVDLDKGEVDARRVSDGKMFLNCPLINFQADTLEEWKEVTEGMTKKEDD